MRFDDELFYQELRQRLERLQTLKGISGAQISRNAEQTDSVYKHFMSLKTDKAYIVAVMGWARALDVPFTTLINNIGYDRDIAPDPTQEIDGGKELRNAEREYRVQTGHNIEFWREVLGKTHAEFAAAARIANEKGPDADYIEACERGDKALSVIQAKHLVDHYQLELSDILPRDYPVTE